MAGFFDSLGQGFRNAGGILSPEVYRQQNVEFDTQLRDRLNTRNYLAQQIIAGIQNGSVDPQQGQAQLQQLGMPVPQMGPTPQAQHAQAQVKADQEFGNWVSQGGLQPSAMGQVPTPPPGVLLSPMFKAWQQQQRLIADAQSKIEDRQDRSADRKAALEQRAAEAEQRSEDRRLDREARAQAQRESLALRAVLAQLARGNSNAPGDYQKTGEEFLQTIPEQDRNFVKKLANYDIDPKTLSTRGGERERYLKMASQYDPNFDQKNYNSISQAINRFGSGPQGNTVRSLNVAIEHMDTAQELAKALKNGNIPAINALANKIAEQTGQAAPTSFNAVKEIVADEVVKGVIGNSGALQDREAAAKKLRDASSPEQFAGVLDSWRKLMGGQLKGLERQYEGSTGRKDFKTRYMTPRALEAIQSSEGKGSTTKDGWKIEPVPQ